MTRFFLLHSKLINILQTHIRNAINNEAKHEPSELLFKTTKNLQYIMKFIIRSRILFAKLNDDRDQDMFEASLEGEILICFFNHHIDLFSLEINLIVAFYGYFE